MARPPKGRFLGRLPKCTLLLPAGRPPKCVLILGPDEAEALRLKDLDGLEGEAAAAAMGVSRPTFQRILDRAREVVARAIFEGAALSITGPRWAVPHHRNCPRCHQRWWLPPPQPASERCPDCDEPLPPFPGKDETTVKIAVVSDDGEHISQHFGWAPYYVVISIVDNQVVSKEVRPKAGHHQEADASHGHHHDGPGHDHHHGPGHEHHHDDHGLHARMAGSIRDCQVVLAGGMGGGAYSGLSQAGLKVHITDQRDIDQAISSYLEGKLPNLLHRLH